MEMHLSTAITLFLKQSVNDQAMPFEPNLKKLTNKQARFEVVYSETEKFDNLSAWWGSMNKID